MSIAVMNDVWRYSRSTGTDRLVLLALADRADEEGECYPSVSTLGKKCLLAPRNVRKHLRNLEELGELTVMRNQGRASSKGGLRSNRYRVAVTPHDTDETVPITRADTDGTVTPDTDGTVTQIRTEPSADTSMIHQLSPHLSGEDEAQALESAIFAACGMDAATVTAHERRKHEAAVREIAATGISPREVRTRGPRWSRRGRTFALTPEVLAGNLAWLAYNPATDPAPAAEVALRMLDAGLTPSTFEDKLVEFALDVDPEDVRCEFRWRYEVRHGIGDAVAAAF